MAKFSTEPGDPEVGINAEAFHVDIDSIGSEFTEKHGIIEPGWYWWFLDLDDAEPNGPFDTEQGARNDAILYCAMSAF